MLKCIQDIRSISVSYSAIRKLVTRGMSLCRR